MKTGLSYRISLLLMTASLPLWASAQNKVWTLDECISHAMEHNIDIKRQELSAEDRRVGVSEARWNYVPDFSAGASYGLSSGRVLDETTYSFIENETAGSSSFSVSGSLDVFGGMRKMHELKHAKIGLKAALADIEAVRYDVRLNVTALYLELVCAKESVCTLEQIAGMLELQEEKTSVKVSAGKVTEADLLQIRARLYSARNDVIAARNRYEIARLDLCQMLEIDDYGSFEAAVPDDVMLSGDSFLHDIEEVVEHHPKVAAAGLEVELAKRDVKIARAYYYPGISLAAGYGSSHSDARQKVLQNADGTFGYEAYPFFRQYVDNASSYVSLSLNIPILTGLSVRKNVQRRKLAVQDAEYALRAARKSVEREIVSARIDARSAWDKYLGAMEQGKFAEEAARQVTAKYEAGTADTITYSVTMSELASARLAVLTAKYEYIFKTRLLSFYKIRTQ